MGAAKTQDGRRGAWALTASALVGFGLVLALAVAPAVFLPPLYDDFTLPKQAVLFLAAASILAGAAVHGDLLPRDRWVRAGLVALALTLTVSYLAGGDRRGATLGVYQYRQGYLTGIAYLVLFVGGLAAVRLRIDRYVPPLAMAGGAAAVAYAAIQALGWDPVSWWTDTAARPIGTIGNPNELAAYVVMAGAVAALALRRHGSRVALVPGVVAVTFVTVESLSRSGLVALGVAAAVFPLLCRMTAMPGPEARRDLAMLGLGVLVAGGLSLAAGGAGRTLDRIERAAHRTDAGAPTRFALWVGTVHTIAASPIVGVGPDNLFLEFPRHRPVHLDGEFEISDLTVQSSHDWVLDTAASTGLLGLSALAFLLGGVARALARRKDVVAAVSPVAWAAIVGYGVMTLLNPLSLAAHAALFTLLGVLCGRAEASSEETAPRARRAALLVGVAPLSLLFAGLAVMLPIADLRADRAWEAYARGDFVEAARGYHEADRLMPLTRDYSRREAQAYLAAGLADTAAFNDADRAFSRFEDRFGSTSAELFSQAAARIGANRPPAEVDEVVDLAVRRNPHGVYVQAYAEQLRAAARGGAQLVYCESARVVVVAPSPLPCEP